MTQYHDVLEDLIFPSFIRSCIPDVNIEKLKTECYQIRDENEGTMYSNRGGYHSPILNEDIEKEEFKKLVDLAHDFVNDTANQFNLNNMPVRSKTGWWFNINKSHHYNILHCHGRADLIGVYYISFPENGGELSLLRKDGSEYGSLYRYVSDMLRIDLSPQVGRLYLIPGHLWHYVTSNEGLDDRISVSFNFYFNL